MEEITSKVCNKCGDEKPISEFHKDRTQKDGYKNLCKPCRSGVQKGYRNAAVTEETNDAAMTGEARIMAIKALIENHKQEYLVLLSRSKKKLGIKSKWISVR